MIQNKSIWFGIKRWYFFEERQHRLINRISKMFYYRKLASVFIQGHLFLMPRLERQTALSTRMGQKIVPWVQGLRYTVVNTFNSIVYPMGRWWVLARRTRRDCVNDLVFFHRQMKKTTLRFESILEVNNGTDVKADKKFTPIRKIANRKYTGCVLVLKWFSISSYRNKF